MIDNVLSFHIDYWYSNSIIDCGEIIDNNSNEKLNNYYYEENNTNLKNDSLTISKRNEKTNNKDNGSNIKGKNNNSGTIKHKDSSDRIYLNEKTNKHLHIHQGTNTNNNKREVQELPSTSRLQEFKQNRRKILLDTFPKFRNINI